MKNLNYSRFLILFSILFTSVQIRAQNFSTVISYSAPSCDKVTEFCITASDSPNGHNYTAFLAINPNEFEITDLGDFSPFQQSDAVFITEPFFAPWDFAFKFCLKGNILSSGPTNFHVVILDIDDNVVVFNEMISSSTFNEIDGSTPVLLSTLYGNANDPLLPPSDALSTPQKVKISGTLIVDEDYFFSFNNEGVSEILMEAGAKILVQSGVTFGIYGNSYLRTRSQVYGCGSLWDRIEAEPGASLYMSTAQIEDGTKAVSMKANNDESNPSYAQIFNSTLLNNQTGFNVDNNFLGDKNAIDVDIIGNHFQKDGNSYTSWSQGISVNDLENIWVASAFNGPFVFLSSFSNLDMGISASNTNLAVTDIQFTRIKNTAVSVYDFSTLTLTNSWDNASNFTVGAAGFGVFGYNSDIDISDASIGAQYAVYSIGTFNGQFSVRESEIRASKYGIRVLGANLAFGSIYDNEMILKSTSSLGNAIEISNASDAGDNFVISNNGPIMVEGEKGKCVNIVNCNNVIVKENESIEQSNDNESAISVEGGSYNRVDCNRATGGSESIYLSGSTQSVVACNGLAGADIALQVFNSCEESTIKGNRFGSNGTDLVYGLNSSSGFAVTGQQPTSFFEEHHGNCFSGSGNVEAIHFGGSGIVELSRYLVNENPWASSCENLEPDNVQAAGIWFQPANDNFGIFACPSSNCNIPVTIPEPGRPKDPRDYVTAALNGSLDAGSYTNAVRWTARRHVFQKLKNQEYIDPQHEDFLVKNEDSNIGKFYDIENTFKSKMQFSEQELADLDVFYNQKKELTQSIQSFHNNIDTSFPIEKQFLNERKDIFQQINKVNASIKQIYEARKERVDNILSDLIAKNNAIIANTTYEKNEKTVNNIHLSYLASNSKELRKKDITNLESIAYQCPLGGGDAVYKARGLLTLTNTDYTFDDEKLCDNSTTNFEKNQQQTISKLEVFPIPASNELNIVTPEFIEKGTITIYNTNGQVLIEQALASGTRFMVDVQSLSSGTYFGVLKSGEQSDQHFKVSVIK